MSVCPRKLVRAHAAGMVVDVVGREEPGRMPCAAKAAEKALRGGRKEEMPTQFEGCNAR